MPLERKRISRLAVKPNVKLRRRRQNDRHGLLMDRRNDGVGVCRQKAEQLVLAFNGSALGAAQAAPGRP